MGKNKNMTPALNADDFLIESIDKPKQKKIAVNKAEAKSRPNPQKVVNKPVSQTRTAPQQQKKAEPVKQTKAPETPVVKDRGQKPKRKKHMFLRGLGIAFGIGSVVAADVGIALLVRKALTQEATTQYTLTFKLGEHGLKFSGPDQVKVEKGKTFSSVTRPDAIGETGYVFDSWSIPEDTVIDKDMEVTANFIASTPVSSQEFTVMFVSSDETQGFITSPMKTKVRANTTFKSINKPYVQANSGYVFNGWSIADDEVITGNTLAIAQFKASSIDVPEPSITVTFSAGQYGNFVGNIPTKVKVRKGTTFRELNKPNIEPDDGYYFNGWKDSDGNDITENTVLAPAKAIKIIAQYTNVKPGVEQFVVLFNAGAHGEIASGDTYVKVWEDTKFGNINKPMITAHTGYTFTGWNIAESTKIKSAVQATAQYIVNPITPPIPEELQCTINFEAGEHGSLSETTAQTIQKGTRFDQLNLPYAIPDNGYMFNGWYILDNKISDSTEFTQNITLTAKFIEIPSPEPTKYTITYSGGSCGTIDPSYTTVEAYEGQTLADVNHPKVTPNEGYTFIGWDVSRDTVISSNLTVTAQYILTPYIGNYVRITFQAGDYGFINGANVYYVEKDLMFSSINKPTVVAKPGYKFVGWNLESSAILSGDLTVSALYEEDPESANKVIVTYNAGYYGYFMDGVTEWHEVVDKQTFVASLSKPTVYPYQSKRFDGWDLKDEQVITADTTLTAQYKDKNPSAVMCLVVFEAGEHGCLSGPTYQLVESGTQVQNVSKPMVYPDANYVFTGWDKEPQTIITGDMTLIAQYSGQTQTEFNITLVQPEASTGWKLSSSKEKAKKGDTIEITVSKTQTNDDKIPYSITIDAKGETKSHDLEKESETVYKVSFTMDYSCDISISLNFKTDHPTDKIYSVIDGKDYVYTIENLCSNEDIILTNYADQSEKITKTRAEFNEQITFPANLEKFINYNFLNGCTSFNQPIDMTNCSNFTEIPAGFLVGCTAFNSEIKLPSNCTVINSNFMQNCTSFNTAIDLKNIKVFGSDFMIFNTRFNQPIEISSATAIYDSFLYGCTAFNQNLIIPNTLTALVDNFMVNCDSMTSTITFNCDEEVIGHSNHSLGSSNSEAACVKTGIKIAGPHASYVVADGFPSGTFESYIHRKTYQ